MKKWLIMVLMMILAGCSSSTATKHYYQLTSDFNASEQLTPQVVNNFIWIESITLPNFLNKNGIVYQYNDVEYVTANNNLWVSSLSEQLQTRLTHDLSILLPGRLISTSPLATPKTKIKLFIDGFHGRQGGDVVIKGRWLITDEKGIVTNKNFDYELRQSEDGYDALVKTLSKGWQEEVVDLVRTIKL